MLNFKSVAITLALIVAATGCATHTIQYKNPSVPANGPAQSAKQSFFLWGLVGGGNVDLQQMCPAGVSQIQSQKGVGDQILTAVTGGLYSPMTVDVRCAGGVATAGGAE